MATTRPNPLLIPTLTDVDSEGSPTLEPPITEIMPDVLAEKVLQIVKSAYNDIGVTCTEIGGIRPSIPQNIHDIHDI